MSIQAAARVVSGARCRAALFLVGLALGWPDSLPGQDRAIPLDTLAVEVNSRASPALGAATRAVEVIDAAAIRNGPAATISDVLQWAFGVELMPRSPVLADIAIRGSSFEQVLVLVDGVRMRDSQTGHFNLNLAVPLEQVERVEVLRGPAASLYGSDAMAGVINIVTRKAGDATSVSVSGGSFSTTSAAAAHQNRLGPVQVDAAGSLQRSDGHRTGTDYDFATGRLLVGAPLGQFPVYAEVAYALRDFGANQFYGSFPSFETTRTMTASARWRAQAANGVSLEPTVHYRRHSDDFILIRENPAFYRNRHTTHQLGADLIGRLPLSGALQAAAGLHTYQDRVRSNTLGDREEWTAGASLELAGGRPGAHTATLGLRADRTLTGSVFLSPGASFAWWPSAGLRVRSSGGRAFRSPTWTERYYRDPQNIGTPDLSPERAWSADVGLDAYPRSGLRLSASGFLRDATDLIDWARPMGSTVPWNTRNVEEARFTGLEAEAELAELLGTRLLARGAWTSMSTSAVAGYDSKYALRPQVESLSLSAERLFLGALVVTVRGTQERRLGEERYNRLDARAAVDVGQVRVWADLNNALDTEYVDIGRQPAPRRNGLIGLEWRFGR